MTCRYVLFGAWENNLELMNNLPNSNRICPSKIYHFYDNNLLNFEIAIWSKGFDYFLLFSVFVNIDYGF